MHQFWKYLGLLCVHGQVTYLGGRSEFVASGSDCGHIFIWSAEDGKLLKVLKGDQVGAVSIQINHFCCEFYSLSTSTCTVLDQVHCNPIKIFKKNINSITGELSVRSPYPAVLGFFWTGARCQDMGSYWRIPSPLGGVAGAGQSKADHRQERDPTERCEISLPV